MTTQASVLLPARIPEFREIVREEFSAAIRPLEVKIEEMDKRSSLGVFFQENDA